MDVSLRQKKQTFQETREHQLEGLTGFERQAVPAVCGLAPVVCEMALVETRLNSASVVPAFPGTAMCDLGSAVVCESAVKPTTCQVELVKCLVKPAACQVEPPICQVNRSM